MADRKALGTDVEGETRVGGERPGVQGVFYVMSKYGASMGSVLALDAIASDGTITTVYLWASSDGKIRTGTTIPTNTEAGTVVGTQT